MMRRLNAGPVSTAIAVAAALALLGGCSSRDYSDLDQFMAEKRSRPGGIIAPIPTFKAYEAFAYSATRLRSPFDRPIEVREITQLQAISAIKPDDNRAKEFLEQFTFDSLAMVGTLERGVQLGAGKGPGRWYTPGSGGQFCRPQPRQDRGTDGLYLAVVEIVSDGTSEGWVERPRTIELSGL
jgi:type IV pilus assembly protein PilP